MEQALQGGVVREPAEAVVEANVWVQEAAEWAGWEEPGREPVRLVTVSVPTVGRRFLIKQGVLAIQLVAPVAAPPW